MAVLVATTPESSTNAELVQDLAQKNPDSSERDTTRNKEEYPKRKSVPVEPTWTWFS